MQVKLLRSLQEKEVRRVGENKNRPINVRIVSATNKNLKTEVVEKRFREDLYYRLNVVELAVPPLRQRREDILPLARLLLAEAAIQMKRAVDGLTTPAAEQLLSYAWPGNVRELRNVIERALILEKTREIQPGSLPDFQFEARLNKAPALKVSGDMSLADRKAQFERELITTILEQNHFNIHKTAEQLKITRHALRYRMQRLNISAGIDADEEPETPLAA
jgi:transcriptional regulator with PAS, ATPase and Fis domain